MYQISEKKKLGEIVILLARSGEQDEWQWDVNEMSNSENKYA